MFGWPTHSAVGGWRCDQHWGEGWQPGHQGWTPSQLPGRAEEEVGGERFVELVTGQVGGREGAVKKTFS